MKFFIHMRLTSFPNNTFGVIVNGIMTKFDLYGNEIRTYEKSSLSVQIYIPDKHIIALGYKTGEVDIYHMRRCFQVIKHDSPIVDIVFSACNSRIISLSTDGKIQINAIIDKWGDTVVMNLNKYILSELANMVVEIIEMLEMI